VRTEPDLASAEAIDGVAVHVDGSVATVTLARPERLNALSLATWARVRDVFGSLHDVAGVRVVLVRGAGDKAFAAGADISEFPELRLSAADAQSYNRVIGDALNSVAALPLPVIAVVHGLAIGGGCELAAACDVRIASTDARLGIPIGKLGVTLGYVESRVLIRLIGPARLKDLLFSARLVDASEAFAIGLVDRVVAPAELEETVSAMVQSIVSAAPVTMRAAKLVTDMCDRPLGEADVHLLTDLTLAAYEGSDLKEGVSAFLEKRRPQFGGGEPDAA
jgi:enoyl-CoA hydratase/carnithine racemase